MKHRLLLLSICVAIFSRSFAQPTLTSSDAPQINEVFTSQPVKSTGISLGTGGANITWNYSTLVDSGSTTSSKVVTPGSTPHPTLFPSSNLALQTLEQDPTYTYGQSSSSALYILGSVTSADTAVYIKPRIYMHFPFTYGSTFSDTVALIVPGYNVLAKGRDSLYGEGYGTLNLPGSKTYSDVLRVKFVEHLSADSTLDFNGLPLTVTIYLTTTNYLYFKPGYHSPLLSVTVAKFSNSLGALLPQFNSEAISASYATDVTLPLNWVSFTSTLQNNQVALKWQTAQEVNTNHFNIQRSFNGNDFTDIGKISATGNSLGSSYSYTDYNVEKLGVSKLYYRLQEIDKDGKAFYSGTNVIELRTINTTKAYPNPANGYINLNIKGATIADAVRIYDMKGRLMQQWQNYPVNRLINVKSFAAGSYILQVQVKGKTTSSTIVKE